MSGGEKVGPGSAVRGEFGDEELEKYTAKTHGGVFRFVAYGQWDYMFNL